MDDDACAADLLCEAVASHRKSVALSARRAPPRRRRTRPGPRRRSRPRRAAAAPRERRGTRGSRERGRGGALAVAAESRGRLATALLALLNSASETELRDVLAGIGAVRARLIVETRSERLFESLDDAFGRIGLSAKQPPT